MTDKLRDVLDKYCEEQTQQLQFINESMMSSIRHLMRMAFMDGVLYAHKQRREQDHE